MTPRKQQATLIDRIARTVEDMRAAGIVVTKQALAVYGDYPTDIVERHGEAACDLARSRQIRQLAAA